MSKKVKKEELSVGTLNELRKALQSSLHDLRRYKGGNVLMLIEPQYVMDIELETLRYLIDYEDLDGVVVTLSRPYIFLHKALARHIKSQRRPYFVDPMSSIAGSLMLESQPQNTKVFKIGGPFEIDRVYAAVDKALNAIAKDYHGDEYFLFVDNIMGVAPYVDIKDTIKLGTRIAKGFRGSFVHKFMGITKTGAEYYKKVYKKLKFHSDIVLLMD